MFYQLACPGFTNANLGVDDSTCACGSWGGSVGKQGGHAAAGTFVSHLWNVPQLLGAHGLCSLSSPQLRPWNIASDQLLSLRYPWQIPHSHLLLGRGIGLNEGHGAG